MDYSNLVMPVENATEKNKTKERNLENSKTMHLYKITYLLETTSVFEPKETTTTIRGNSPKDATNNFTKVYPNKTAVSITLNN